MRNTSSVSFASNYPDFTVFCFFSLRVGLVILSFNTALPWPTNTTVTRSVFFYLRNGIYIQVLPPTGRYNNSITLTLQAKESYRICIISGFRREEDENCVVMGYYAASSGNSL